MLMSSDGYSVENSSQGNATWNGKAALGGAGASQPVMARLYPVHEVLYASVLKESMNERKLLPLE